MNVLVFATTIDMVFQKNHTSLKKIVTGFITTSIDVDDYILPPFLPPGDTNLHFPIVWINVLFYVIDCVSSYIRYLFIYNLPVMEFGS